MTIENQDEGLVGPRSDERGERVIEGVTLDGRPIYEVFMADTPVVSSSEVENAKNAYDSFKLKHPDVIEMCQREPLEKCIEAVASLRKVA